MKPFHLLYVTAIVGLGSHVMAIPVDTALEEASSTEVKETVEAAPAENIKETTTPGPSQEVLDTSSSNQEAAYVLPEHHGSGGQPTFDPSIYAGYLTPEAFQQYLSQFAGAFAPYAYPGYGPAPAPVYPGPFAVQTGYDGFLVPSVSASLSASGTAASTSTSIASSILSALQNLIPSLMGSTVAQIILSALGALAMILFGGAITTAICNLTPLCDISFKAVTYLRGSDAADVGRMIAENVTPERVRRASEFVRHAIRKYKEMQKMMRPEDDYVNNMD